MQASKILVTTDLTEISDIATEYAADLALQLKSRELVLLNVLIPVHIQTTTASGGIFNPSYSVASRLNETLWEKHTSLVEKQAEKYAKPGIKIKPVVEINRNKADINHFMEEYHADLLITGSRDKLNFMEILLGSETEKIMRKINYPMIVITDEPFSSTINNILVAIDVEVNNEQQKGIEIITEFATLVNAHLQLLYVVSNGKISAATAIERLQQLAITHNIRNYSINTVENHNLESAIQNFSRKHKPDMIALLNQGKGKLHNLIYGSQIGEVIKESELPVFVANSI
ncbi:MAG: universal stress protein [Bacteroidota bacterium]